MASNGAYHLNDHSTVLPPLFLENIFTGDGALRIEVGYYKITGRVDVIIVSGHNLGTAPIETL
jgi:acyl-coenzyme A synthetase/AMP-(fatty) acid ligase